MSCIKKSNKTRRFCLSTKSEKGWVSDKIPKEVDYFWTSASKRPTAPSKKRFWNCAAECRWTFYAHYEDIYALSSRLEDKLIADILASVSAVELHPVRTEALTRELFRAFVQNKTAVNILFADSRQGIFANRIEKGLRERLTAQDPTFANDPKRGILLSFCVQGCFYAFTNNSSRMDERHLVDLLAEIARAAQKIKM